MYTRACWADVHVALRPNEDVTHLALWCDANGHWEVFERVQGAYARSLLPLDREALLAEWRRIAGYCVPVTAQNVSTALPLDFDAIGGDLSRRPPVSSSPDAGRFAF